MLSGTTKMYGKGKRNDSSPMQLRYCRETYVIGYFQHIKGRAYTATSSFVLCENCDAVSLLSITLFESRRDDTVHSDTVDAILLT